MLIYFPTVVNTIPVKICLVSLLTLIYIDRFELMMINWQKQWSTVFCGIVSRAMTIEILSSGVAGNYNGALQVALKVSKFSFLIL